MRFSPHPEKDELMDGTEGGDGQCTERERGKGWKQPIRGRTTRQQPVSLLTAALLYQP